MTPQCPECLRSTPCPKCAPANESPCLTPTQCGKAAGCFVCLPDGCPGDGTHYFNKGETPCRCCGRDLTDHKIGLPR